MRTQTINYRMCTHYFFRSREPMAIIKKQIDSLGDKKNTTKLTLTVSLKEALEEVERAREAGGRIGTGSNEKCMLFRVPQELWVLDPLLKKADFYRRHGDMGQYTRYIRMWMKLNPKLCVPYERRIFATR